VREFQVDEVVLFGKLGINQGRSGFGLWKNGRVGIFDVIHAG
jgi:hypothetical protein